MKNILRLLSVSLVLAISCDSSLVDFTDVTNPNLSESNVVGQPNSAEAWLAGIDRQLSIVVNASVDIAEIASDNYVNTQTFFNQLLDNLTIDFKDPDMSTFQFGIARLRALTVFGIERVAPGDPNATEETIAEYYFYNGLSYLYAGEYFSFLPDGDQGEPLSSDENLQKAIESFQIAIDIQNLAKYQLGLARAYHGLGDKSNAVSAANEALSIDPDALFQARFDNVNGPTNTIEGALFGRGNFDDYQPLPSLDFLDPKYSFLSNDQDPPIAILKAEEAHFIIAEAQLSDGNLDDAQSTMKDAIDLIASRPVRDIDDTVEGRIQDAPGSRPDNSSVQVRYVGQDDYRSGLVTERDESVEVASVSGTSIEDSDVDDTDSVDEALELLYLMRQEVFIAEGRRIVDMGVKFVIHENEQLLNDNIDANHPGLTGVIPPFIDSIKTELDAFTYDADAGTVDITHNVNAILVANKSSDLVIPFF